MNHEEYLGDGLYVSFDGFGFMLRAPRENGDHWVYLEPPACEAFARFIENCTRDLRVSKNPYGEGDPAETEGT